MARTIAGGAAALAFIAFWMTLVVAGVHGAPTAATAAFSVCVLDSTGAGLAGARIETYKSGWKDLGSTPSTGCVPVDSAVAGTTFAATRDGIRNELVRSTASDANLVFTTVPVTFVLQSSAGEGLSGGAAEYYASGWKGVRSTGRSGSVTIELLPANLTFAMTRDGIRNERVQDTAKDPVVIFQTVAATVHLTSSAGTPLAGGVAEFYGAGWKSAGTTGGDGNAVVELLPANLTFAITRDGIRNEKVQDLHSSATVHFATVAATAALADSTGKGLEGGVAEYYGAGWKSLGTTGADGRAALELLPANLTFSMTRDGIRNEKVQDLHGSTTVQFATVPATALLVDSAGKPLAGGVSEYYGSGWKQLGTTGADGRAIRELLPANLTFAITRDGIRNEKVHDLHSSSVVQFATVPATVLLVSSSGAGLEGGVAEYYGSGWKPLGTTGSDGRAVLELLPANLTFAVTRDGIRNEQVHDLHTGPTARFATVAATVALVTGDGAGIEGGRAEYYGSGWKTIGLTGADGLAVKELLPANLTFAMTRDGIRNEKVQDLRTSPRVVFTTVATTVKLVDSRGVGLAGGEAEYYGAGWKSLGTTGPDGLAVKQLLPANLTFAVTRDGIRNEKVQDSHRDATVVFATVAADALLRTSDGKGLDGGVAEYYGAGWKSLGTTDSGGHAVRELLPANLTFAMTRDGIRNEKVQNLATSATVAFTTVPVAAHLKTSTGKGLDEGVAEYYGAGWKPLGTTGADGRAVKELLPANLTFAMTRDGIRNEKVQNTATSPNVTFTTVAATVSLLSSDGKGLDGATVEYYGAGWKLLGTTNGDGHAVKELLPANLTFAITRDGIRNERVHNLATAANLAFKTVAVRVLVYDDAGSEASGAKVEYYGAGWKSLGVTNKDGVATKELLPANLTFAATASNRRNEQVQDIAANASLVFGKRASATATPTATATRTPSPTATATGTATRTATPSATTTASPTVTASPSPSASASPSPTATPSPQPSATATPTNTPTLTPTPAKASGNTLQRTTPTPADTGRRATLADAKPGLVIDPLPAEEGVLKWRVSPRTAGQYTVTWSVSQFCGDGEKPCPLSSAALPLCEAGEGATCPETGDRSSFSFDGANANGGIVVTMRLADSNPEVCTVKAAFTWNGDGRRGTERASYTCSGASAMGWPLLAVAFLAAVAAATVLVRRSQLWPR